MSSSISRGNAAVLLVFGALPLSLASTDLATTYLPSSSNPLPHKTNSMVTTRSSGESPKAGLDKNIFKKRERDQPATPPHSSSRLRVLHGKPISPNAAYPDAPRYDRDPAEWFLHITREKAQELGAEVFTLDLVAPVSVLRVYGYGVCRRVEVCWCCASAAIMVSRWLGVVLVLAGARATEGKEFGRGACCPCSSTPPLLAAFLCSLLPFSHSPTHAGSKDGQGSGLRL